MIETLGFTPNIEEPQKELRIPILTDVWSFLKWVSAVLDGLSQEEYGVDASGPLDDWGPYRGDY